MNLWMVYTCNVKSSAKYKTKRWEEDECTLHCWRKSFEICGGSRPSRNFKGNEEKVIVRNWKKGKLKNKYYYIIKYYYILGDVQEPSVQSADRTKAVQVWSW